MPGLTRFKGNISRCRFLSEMSRQLVWIFLAVAIIMILAFIVFILIQKGKSPKTVASLYGTASGSNDDILQVWFGPEAKPTAYVTKINGNFIYSSLGNVTDITFQEEYEYTIVINNIIQNVTLKINEVLNHSIPIYRHQQGMISRVDNVNSKQKYAFYHDLETKASIALICSHDTKDCRLCGAFNSGNLRWRIKHNGLIRSNPGGADEYLAVEERDVTFDLDGIQPPEINTFNETSANSTEAKRVRRAVKNPTYFVELLAFPDTSVMHWFLEQANYDIAKGIDDMVLHYTLLINEMSLFYESVSKYRFGGKQLKVKLHLSGVLPAFFENESPWSNTSILDAEDTLQRFAVYQFSVRQWLHIYDIGLAFTRKNIVTGNIGVMGIAYIKQVCENKGLFAVTLQADTGNTNLGHITAHELGHTLGAYHDPKSGPCNTSNQYTMAGSINKPPKNKRENPWIFSNCSASAFYKHISAKGSCLLSHGFTIKNIQTNKSKGLKGKLLNQDEQCKLTLGEKYYACKSKRKLSDICHDGILCGTKGCKINRSIATLPGTTCGTNKICLKGACRKDTSK